MSRRPRAPVSQAFPPPRLVWDRDRDDNGQEHQEHESAAAPASPVAHDTILVLEQLLDDARKGELVGITFAALYSHRGYCAKATDDLRENPTFARGCVAALDDERRRLVEATV